MALRLKELPIQGYESVLSVEDPQVGLSGIIAIHHTGLGPACGGIRMLPYKNYEEALQDVLRLARGMSYKSSLAGIGFGGGKSVLIGEAKTKTPTLLQAFGEAIEHLKGKYIAAKDMNIDSRDLKEVKKKTPHVLGIEGEPKSSGDPSPVTARGVLRAMEATWQHLTGTRDLKGVTVAIEGIGHVGFQLAQSLHDLGAHLIVGDINQTSLHKAQTQLKAKVIPAETIHAFPCDIYAPCARGAILNAKTIPELKCRAIVGAANNQLLEPQNGNQIKERDILYVPDYAVNSGGIINIFVEFESYSEVRAFQKTDQIFDTIKGILERAKKENRAPYLVADKMAEERLNASR